MKAIYSRNSLILLLFFFLGLSPAAFSAVVTNTNDAGPGSLRDAVDNAIFGENITFDNAIAGQTITLLSELTPGVNMTIDGTDKDMTISGGGTTRIINLTVNITFEIGRLTLTNGVGTGAAIYSTAGSNISGEEVVFKDNVSGNDGGAIRAQGGNQTFASCAFIGNQATFWGGGYYQLFGATYFENCLFSGNRADRGGGIFIRGGSVMKNCTFASNYALNSTGGGAMHCFNGANVTIENGIYWNNQAGGNLGTIETFYTMDSGSPSAMEIYYSIIEGSGGSGSWDAAFGSDGGNNLDVDPNFENQLAAASAPTSGGNYRPQVVSPAHDSGNNAYSSLPTDLDGFGRVMFGVVDRGCYEFCTTYSSATLTVCDTWTSPGGNVQTVSGVYQDTLANWLGCDSIITTNLTVDNTAIVDAGVDIDICEDQGTVVLSGSLTNAGGVNWTGGTGSFSDPNVLTPSYIITAPDIIAGTVTLTMTSTGNGACAAISDNVVITINPLPTVSAGADMTLCDGDMASLSGAGTAITYTWDNGVFDGIPFTPPVGVTTYTVTGTDGNGCINTDQMDITVNANPIVNMTTTDADQIICLGESVSFNASGGYPNYEFFINASSVQNGASPLFSTTGLVSGDVVTVEATSLGCTTLSPDSFTFTVNPLPTVTFGVMPTLCEDDPPYTLTQGSPIGGLYSGNGVSAGDFDPSIALAGIHTLSYTYTDGNGCTDSASQNVTVLNLPNIIASGASPICDGNSTTISAVGGVSYSWDNTIGLGQTQVVLPTTTTTYTVTGTDANGCSNTDMVTITVNPLPGVTFGALTPLCMDGPPYTFIEGSPAGGTYSGPGVAGGVITQALAGLGIHTIYYTYTDGNGCTNIDSSDIEIYNSPTVVANVTSTDICDGQSVTFTGSGALSYTWDNGVTDGTPFTPIVGSQSYVVTGSDANGCVNYDTVVVTVNALPIVGAGLDQSICEGDFVTLSGTGAVIYTWNNGVTDGASFAPTSTGTTTYTVTGTDVNGCQNTDDVDVTVNPNPVLTVSSDQIFCLGGVVSLVAAGADSYNWDSGAGNLASYQISPTTSTNVNVVGSTTFGCQTSADIFLTLDDPNNVDAGADQQVCEGFTAYLSASGGTDYFWNGPGIFNDNNQDISFSVDTTAYYYVTVTTPDGCVYTDSVLVSISTDPNCTIATVSSITPNNDGDNDFWNIQGIEGFIDNHVVIYNRWGDVVFDETGYDNDLVKWDGTRNGNVLGAGTYFYLIEITNGPTQSGWIQLMK